MPRQLGYAAINARGVTLRTFNNLACGKAWVKQNQTLHVGLELHEQEIISRRVYKPRLLAYA